MTEKSTKHMFVVIITHLIDEDQMRLTEATNENNAVNQVAGSLGLHSHYTMNDDGDVSYVCSNELGDRYLLHPYEFDDEGVMVE